MVVLGGTAVGGAIGLGVVTEGRGRMEEGREVMEEEVAMLLAAVFRAAMLLLATLLGRTNPGLISIPGDVICIGLELLPGMGIMFW